MQNTLGLKDEDLLKNTQLSNLQADSIDGVIDSLTRIVEWSKLNKHRAGYFAALYRKVTIRIRDGINNKEFENGPRMERLDVIFANRYLAAFEQWHAEQKPTLVWQQAFDLSEKWRPIVLQHLMIGMNAHINFDLGIAAAQTVSKDEMPSLKEDFDKINGVLASLVNSVEDELAEIWPVFRWIDRLAGGLDEKLADISMEMARDQAWQRALDYSSLAGEQREMRVKTMDEAMFHQGKLATNPVFPINILLLIIRMGELKSVSKIIQILE